MKIGNDYGVFVMHEHLKNANLLERQYDIGLDAVWEYCVAKYIHFLSSDYNNDSQSEYDCIRDYVNSILSADQIVKQLINMDVDGETMEYIVSSTNMSYQLLRQLLHKASDSDIKYLLEERSILKFTL